VIKIKDQLLIECEKKMNNAVENTQHEFNTIRTGRASAALLDRIFIDYYGTKTQLKHLSNISIPEARAIVIAPYEPKFLKDIEKQILASDLGLNPSNDGKVIRLSIPQLNEERRLELVKLVKGIAEDGRISIRNIRREINDDLKKLENDKEITEDDRIEYHKKIQDITDSYIEKINEAVTLKEKEIMEV
jgi:ribosome recycling factor